MFFRDGYTKIGNCDENMTGTKNMTLNTSQKEKVEEELSGVESIVSKKVEERIR